MSLETHLVERSDGGAPKSLQIEVFALRTAPAGRSPEAFARSITAEAGSPFRATANLPLGSAWLEPGDARALRACLVTEGDPAQRTGQQLGAASAFVLAGAQTVVTTSLPRLPVVRLDNDAGRCRVRIDVTAPGDGGVHHLTLRDPLPDEGPCALFVPAVPGATFAGHALVLTAAAGPADPAAAEAAFSRARTDAPPPAASTAAQEAGIAASMVGEHNRRPALLAIARSLALPACIDAILSADEAHLAAITRGLGSTAADDPERPWRFEAAVWSAMLPALQHDELPFGLRSCLLRHFGALGGDATTLQTLLAASRDAASFARAVQEENVLALASRDVVQRVRGHDWLVARGSAVPDYDPLAPVAARRQALRRHAEATADAEVK